MIISLSINLVLCFRKFVYCCIHIFNCENWTSWTDRPFIMGDIKDKFIILLSTNILSMAVLELFWILVTKLTVCDILYIVNNEARCLFGFFQWDNLCLCLHKLKIMYSALDYTLPIWLPENRKKFQVSGYR